MFLKIYQSSSDSKLYTGGNKPKKIYNYTYVNFAEEDKSEEDHVDFFIGTLLGTEISAADTVYTEFDYNLNMKF